MDIRIRYILATVTHQLNLLIYLTIPHPYRTQHSRFYEQYSPSVLSRLGSCYFSNRKIDDALLL